MICRVLYSTMYSSTTYIKDSARHTSLIERDSVLPPGLGIQRDSQFSITASFLTHVETTPARKPFPALGLSP